MSNNAVVVPVSVAAAFAFALSTSLKHVSAGDLPDAQGMRLRTLGRFVRATMSHRWWLAGIGCDVVGLSLQIVALHLGALTVVQPLLVSSLLFALFLRGRFEHQHITGQQLSWAVTLTAALAGFLLLSSTGASPATEPADRGPAAVAGALGLVVVAACIVVGRRQPDGGRTAALLGVALGAIYAGTAALIKAASNIAARNPSALFVSWQLYTVIAVGGSGLLLSQLTFQAGPLTASLPATATVDPLLSIVIGVAVYDEHLSNGLGADALLVLLLAVMGTAILQIGPHPDRPPTLRSHGPRQTPPSS